jgi:peptidoglycan/xylan/chitin deacetylase (PgdA/CDA1 family)
VSRRQLTEILDVVQGRSDVRLTFDDGNRSDVDEALPALTERGLRAQFFVCPGRFGADGFVDAEDVRALRSAGMSIGSHGMDHVHWRRLEPSAVEREIVQAKRELEAALEAPVEAAACPFGAYDRRTLRALRGAGFRRVYTSDGGPAGARDWLVTRNTVHRWDSAASVERMLDGAPATASPAQRAKRRIKRWR